jgi:hypothetical protein
VEEAMNVTHILAASLIGSLLIPSGSDAQTLPAPGALRQSIERQAIMLARADAATAQSAAPRQQRWPARHPIALGAIIGAGVGAGWGSMQCRTACEGGALTPYITAYGAAMFAGIGAGIGAIVAVARH